MTLVAAMAAAPARPAGAAVDVRRTWLADCAVCHGAEGRGTERGPSLAGIGTALVDYELSTRRMPQPFEGRRPVPYGPATIDALDRYVTTLVAHGGPAIPTVRGGDVARGSSLFLESCAACHSWSGDGGALYHREAPDLHASTSQQIAEAVRAGPGQMPAFGAAALTDQQVADVVRYVRYLRHPDDRGGAALHHLGPVGEGAVGLAGLLVLLVVCVWIGDRDRSAG